MGINNSCTGCESTEPTVAEVNDLLGNLKDCAGAPLEIGDKLVKCEVFDAAVEDLNDAIAAEEAARIAGDAATLASALAADKDYVDCSGTAIADGAALATCANLNTAVATEQTARIAGDAATLASALAADKDYVDCSGTAIADGAALATCADLNTAIAAIPPNPTTLPPNGAAGGALAGTYPNPTFNAAAFTASFDTNFASKNASPAQAVAGTDDTVFSSPADVKAYIDAQFATLADMLAGTDNTKIVNPKDVKDALSTGQDYPINIAGDTAMVTAITTSGTGNPIGGQSNVGANPIAAGVFTRRDPTPNPFGVENSGVRGIIFYNGNITAGIHEATTGYLSASVGGMICQGALGRYDPVANIMTGVYGRINVVPGGTTAYAGYFLGDVFSTGAYLPSDNKVKENVKVLSSIGDLEVIEYDLVLPETPAETPIKDGSDEALHAKVAAPQEKAVAPRKVGFRAEQVQARYPNLVKAFNADSTAVDYTQLQTYLIAEMSERISKLEALLGSSVSKV